MHKKKKKKKNTVNTANTSLLQCSKWETLHSAYTQNKGY